VVRTPVKSSNIAEIGYDQSNEVLEVKFTSGGLYRYFRVEPLLNEDFLAADSKGEFFAQNIKGKYDFERVR